MAERIVGHVRVDSGYLLLCDPTRLQAEDFELLRDWFAVIGNHGGMWPDAAPVQTPGGGLVVEVAGGDGDVVQDLESGTTTLIVDQHGAPVVVSD